jgi:hypothetical protein
VNVNIVSHSPPLFNEFYEMEIEVENGNKYEIQNIEITSEYKGIFLFIVIKDALTCFMNSLNYNGKL